MKISYTTETYLIKEITKDTPATKAVEPNDLVQFVAYKDRNDYGGTQSTLKLLKQKIRLKFLLKMNLLRLKLLLRN